MAGPNDPDNPNYKPPKKSPAKKSAPLPKVNRPAEPTPGVKVLDKRYVNPSRWPGLMQDEGGANAYQGWMSRLAVNDPFTLQLINAYGAEFQAFAWRAYQDELDDIVFMNQVRLRWPDYESRLTGIAGTGGGGGGGRSGGGGGGGGGGSGGAPTPQQIAAAKAAIKNKVASLGLPALSDEELTAKATTVVTDNWTDDMLTDDLTADPSKITQPGDLSATVDKVKAMAASQLSTISDATAREWSVRIISGEMTAEAVASIFHQQAAAEFGWAAEGLQQGLTMRDILMPARDKIANELEIGAEQVDLMDPKWRAMTQVTGTDGAMRAATMTEVTRAARKDSGWAKTNNAARLAANTAMMLRQIFEG